MTIRLPIHSYVVPRLDNEAAAPTVPLRALDTVWFQLAGTLCNLACRHCFVPSGPKEDRAPLMTATHVARILDEAEALGVRDYYFTGGEPMIHPEFEGLCEQVLARGPLTVLSNGTQLDAARAQRLAAIADATRYSFELRISLDGMTAAQNDEVRGAGSFAMTVDGLRALAAAGFDPIVTVVEHEPMGRGAFLAFLASLGLARVRCKFLPLLRIGREPRRSHAYDPAELAALYAPLTDDATRERLACSSSRLVSAHGVHICPLLLDGEGALLGPTLHETLGPQRLRWAACKTCLVDGLECKT